MKKEPLTNEEMKALVGHYLTDKFGRCKYAITGYKVDINGDVVIHVAGSNKEYLSAEDLMENKYLRIDKSDGGVPWNIPLLKEVDTIIDKFDFQVFKILSGYIDHSAALIQLNLNHIVKDMKVEVKTAICKEAEKEGELVGTVIEQEE